MRRPIRWIDDRLAGTRLRDGDAAAVAALINLLSEAGGGHAGHVAAFRELWGYQERDFDAWAALTVRSASFLPGLSRSPNVYRLTGAGPLP